MSDNSVSRRHVLRTTGAGVAVAGLGGIASAEEQIEINVGYANQAGRRAAVDAADGVKREFAFDALTIRAPRSALSGLQNNPNVRYAEENGKMHALDQTVPWGIEKVKADIAIDEGETGDSVSVAIIDTGIDATHEDLEANLGNGWAADDAACQDDCTSGPFCSPNDIDTCYEEWDDDHDHGSHVAGTVGALDNDLGVLGVAPDVTLHAVKVLDCCGGGTWDGIAAGIEWSADQGHDVSNMSLGGDTDADVLADAVEYADQQGVIQVAAAGNEGEDDSVLYPAAYEEVIAVSATDEDDELADFSSRGEEVEIAAPGVDVLSTIPRSDYAEFSGTSMASPHVAGGAAHLVANNYGPEEARDRLKETADDIGLDEDEQGAGRLNVAAALGIEDDDDDDDDDEEHDPVIDQFDVNRRTSGPWSRADVEWTVSDEDGDLDTVTTELLDSAGAVLDSETSNVSGSSASGEHNVRTREDPDAVRLTVTDEADNSTSETKDY